MDKIKVGIIGYGNLGKSLEKLLLRDSRFKLVKIFERSDTMTADDKLNIAYMRKFEKKIDVMFLCVGSKSCLEKLALPLSKYFNIIDAYDNHNKIPAYLEKMEKCCEKYDHASICCCGWDPGLFSLMRLIFNSVEGKAFTFWGKGVSQGHTQAIKEIDGVINGVQYTLPSKKVLKAIIKGNYNGKNTKDLHKRLCYVQASGNKKDIREKIKNMPDYFEGYDTTVKFVKNLSLSPNLYHSGRVLTLNDTMDFTVKMDSNPHFTAKILLAYSIALMNLYREGQYKAFSILDLPPKYLALQEYRQYI